MSSSEMKVGRYASRSDGDSIEELSKRLTADLRRHIRSLVIPRHWRQMLCCGSVGCRVPWLFLPARSSHCATLTAPARQGACAILSEEWNEVADVLARIADIAQMVGTFFMTVSACSVATIWGRQHRS